MLQSCNFRRPGGVYSDEERSLAMMRAILRFLARFFTLEPVFSSRGRHI